MIPAMFQDDLVEEIKKITSGMIFKTTRGGESRLHVFPQSLPVLESMAGESPDVEGFPLGYEGSADTEEEAQYIPYAIVKLNDGNVKGGENSRHIVSVVITLCIWDDDKTAQGHRDILNIMDKIYERFAKKTCLNGYAVYNDEYCWKLQEDESYPYYFGACYLTFVLPAIRREDKFA